MNPLDAEAYKILSKILAKEEKYDEAISIMKDAIANCESSGDLYYITAEIYKNMDNIPDYKLYLNEAIKHNQTLSIPIQTVKKS